MVLTFRTAPAHEKYSKFGYRYLVTIGEVANPAATVGTSLARVALVSCNSYQMSVVSFVRESTGSDLPDRTCPCQICPSGAHTSPAMAPSVRIHKAHRYGKLRSSARSNALSRLHLRGYVTLAQALDFGKGQDIPERKPRAYHPASYQYCAASASHRWR